MGIRFLSPQKITRKEKGIHIRPSVNLCYGCGALPDLMDRMNNLYVEVHALQTVPPSCINRDDAGSPKSCLYGGVRRSRVSSQSWKSALRAMFPSFFDKEQLGYRTKLVLDLLIDRIKEKSPDVDAEAAGRLVLDMLGMSIRKKKNETQEPRELDALLFISDKQIDTLAELAVMKSENKKAYREAFRAAPSIDIALFGRMVAIDSYFNVDACCQVAHAIATHAAPIEFDYFTAVDDCSHTSGSSHVGVKEFCSSTLYRYANVNVTALKREIGSDVSVAVAGFVNTFVRSMPTGFKNSYANVTFPDLVYVTFTDQPVNLVSAFEKPVKADGAGYMGESKVALFNYAKEIYGNYGFPEKAYSIGSGMGELSKETLTLSQLLETVKAEVAAYCNQEA